MKCCVRIHSKKATMQQSLFLCFMFLFTLVLIKAKALNISSKAKVGDLSAYFPLNISAVLSAHPWMLHQCSHQDKSHFCEGIADLTRILYFSWMRSTRSFLLLANHTAAICLKEFQRQLEAQEGIGAEPRSSEPATQGMEASPRIQALALVIQILYKTFCVADLKSQVIVNGFPCKNPMMVTAKDFLLKGLDKPGNTNNQLGFVVMPAFLMQPLGLNTLGISMVRLDYAPLGLNPPHTHLRATEILVVNSG